MWDEIVGLYYRWDLPWCIDGDFNDTCFPSERLGESHCCYAMEEFSKLIFDLDILDLPLVGGSFKWSNNHVWSLDRIEFWFLFLGRRIFLICAIIDLLGYVQTILLSCWNVPAFGRVDSQKESLFVEFWIWRVRRLLLFRMQRY